MSCGEGKEAHHINLPTGVGKKLDGHCWIHQKFDMFNKGTNFFYIIIYAVPKIWEIFTGENKTVIKKMYAARTNEAMILNKHLLTSSALMHGDF